MSRKYYRPPDKEDSTPHPFPQSRERGYPETPFPKAFIRADAPAAVPPFSPTRRQPARLCTTAAAAPLPVSVVVVSPRTRAPRFWSAASMRRPRVPHGNTSSSVVACLWMTTWVLALVLRPMEAAVSRHPSVVVSVCRRRTTVLSHRRPP